MVTDTGGIDDKSFNASAWAGINAAKTQATNVDPKYVASTAESDYEPNLRGFTTQNCNFILAVGGLMGDATTKVAKEATSSQFAIVDSSSTASNIYPMQFETDEAAFLGGYLAAGYSKTGTVATFGGMNQPPVTLFMDGFVDGVAKYNAVHGAAVVALGWDKATQNGSFTGDFEDINKGKTLTQSFIDQGADVILPVGGQVGEGAASAALEHGGVSVIWVDNDGYDTLPAQYRPILLTSVMKNTGDAVVQIVGDDLAGSFSATPFVGTLANGGVALAPFHDLAASVPAALSTELDALKADIASGAVVVQSPSTP